VRPDLADCESQSQRQKTFSQHLFYRLEILFGEPDDRGPRAAETHTKKIGMPERQSFFQPGYEIPAKRLMHAVLQSFSQEGKVTTLKGLKKKCEPLQVEDRVMATNRLR